MAVDIFVHPALPTEDSDPRWLMFGYQDFQASAFERMESSDLAVVIDPDLSDQLGHAGVNAFNERVDPQDRLIGIQDRRGGLTAFLDGDNLDRLVQRIHEAKAERILIHGCYIGYSLVGAATQLLAAVQFDRSLFTNAHKIGSSFDIMEQIVGEGPLRQDLIRYGDAVVYPTDEYRVRKDLGTGTLTNEAAGLFPGDVPFVDQSTDLYYLGID